jgi:RNA polymerase sigma-70 factor (ECF subfamily)
MRSAVFLDTLPAEARASFAELPDLEDRLSALVNEARAAWPSVAVPEERFLAHVAGRLASGGGGADSLGRLRAGDLYLACACAGGDPNATAAFLENFMPQVHAALASLGAGSGDREELVQHLADLLFVADGDRPGAIATYSGRGSLRSWVRSVAVRTGMRQLGRARAAAADDEALASVPAADDQEIHVLRARYGEAFRAAFRDALAALTPRQRNLLKQHTIDELTVDQIGRLYRVHRATAARWVAAARDELCEGTRRRLIERLSLAGHEVDSILRLVWSQLDVSITTFLGGKSGGHGS